QHDARDAVELRILRESVQELPTVHHRHPQVEKDCIRSLPLLESCQSLPAVAGGDHRVAPLDEYVLEGLSDLVVIIDDHEHGTRLRAGRSRAGEDGAYHIGERT